MARRAYQEWLEVMPADRIMWGAGTVQAEGIYAATVWTRQCLSEALADKVERGELREEDAVRIGRQVLRDNALKLPPCHLRGADSATTPTSFLHRAPPHPFARAHQSYPKGKESPAAARSIGAT